MDCIYTIKHPYPNIVGSILTYCLEWKMALDMKTDALEYFISDIGCMPYTVYRIHDTTNHLLTNCLWFVYDLFINSFNNSFNQLFFLCSMWNYYIMSIVITITFISVTFSYFIDSLQNISLSTYLLSFINLIIIDSYYILLKLSLTS